MPKTEIHEDLTTPYLSHNLACNVDRFIFKLYFCAESRVTWEMLPIAYTVTLLSRFYTTLSCGSRISLNAVSLEKGCCADARPRGASTLNLTLNVRP